MRKLLQRSFYPYCCIWEMKLLVTISISFGGEGETGGRISESGNGNDSVMSLEVGRMREKKRWRDASWRLIVG